MENGKVVSVTVRMDEEAKALWKRLAEHEGRSMGNYLHRLLKRESDEMVTTLDSLDGKLDLIISFTKPKPRKDRLEPTAHDIDTGEVMTTESWEAWIEHMKVMGRPMNHHAAELHFKEFCRHDKDGYNCDTLVKEITERYPWTWPIVPNEWKHEKVKGGY